MRMKSLVFVRYSDWHFQFYWPFVSHTEFGYGIHFRTSLTVGRRTFALVLLGFGFGFAHNRMNTQLLEGKRWGFE